MLFNELRSLTAITQGRTVLTRNGEVIEPAVTSSSEMLSAAEEGNITPLIESNVHADNDTAEKEVEIAYYRYEQQLIDIGNKRKEIADEDLQSGFMDAVLALSNAGRKEEALKWLLKFDDHMPSFVKPKIPLADGAVKPTLHSETVFAKALVECCGILFDAVEGKGDQEFTDAIAKQYVQRLEILLSKGA